MAYLVAILGPAAKKRYDIPHGKAATIGRHSDCEISIPEIPGVSRHHAQILWDEGGYYVRDLKSLNHTFLNKVQVGDERQPLKNGDELAICNLVFRFQEDAPVRVNPMGPDLLGQKYVPGEESSASVLIVDDELRPPPRPNITSKVDVAASPDGVVRVSASLPSKLTALMEITRSLGKALALDQVLPQVLHSLFKIFIQADRGFIVLRSPEGELIPRWSMTRKGGSDDMIRISRTIVKQVMESKEACLSEDASEDGKFDMAQSIAELRIRSMICAPLLDSEGNALGVIQVDTQDHRKQFKKDDLDVLVTVAVQAGIAIHNAQLHEASIRQKEVEHDLELAHEVQRAFLPRVRPSFADYQFFDFYEPMDHIGGDYYDYIPLPDGRMAVLVADVVGHGVAAAMLMAKLSAEAKFCLALEHRPAVALTKLNDRMSSLQLERFVTLLMIVLDPIQHQATIVNAGHMAPICRRADGSLHEPGDEVKGLPVGILEGTTYDQLTITLAPGEAMFMYTDGLNEAMDANEKQFGIDRMRKHLQQRRGTLTELGESMIGEVRNFVGSSPQTDDMCLVGFARN